MASPYGPPAPTSASRVVSRGIQQALAEWVHLTRRCSVGGPMPVTFVADAVKKDGQFDCIRLMATVDTVNRFALHRDESGWRTKVGLPISVWTDVDNDGDNVRVFRTEYVDPSESASQDKLLDMAVQLYKHEVSEWFLIDGKHAYEPHS